MEMCLEMRVSLSTSLLSLKAAVLNLRCSLESPGELLKIFIPRLYPKPIYISIPGAGIQALVLFKAPRAISVAAEVENPCFRMK